MTLTLVLLPGLHGTDGLFGSLAAALPPGWHAQLEGYPEREVVGYDDLVARVRARLPAGGPFVLLGESFSGPIAVRLAAEAPPGLRGLVLCGSFVRRPVGWFLSALARAFIGVAVRLPRPRWVSRLAVTGGDRDVAARALAEVRRVAPAVMAHRVRQAVGVDVRAELARCPVPVLYLAGARDRLIRRRCVRDIQAVRPDVVVETLEAPHLILQTAPAAAAAALERWAAGLGVA